MPNIAIILKNEIARIVRREVRRETEKLKTTAASYRLEIRDLKQQVRLLQVTVARLVVSSHNTAPESNLEAQNSVTALRWSPARFAAHRQRLNLSCSDCGLLFDVSQQTIRNWENGARPSSEHLAKMPMFRKLTRPRVMKLLQSLHAKAGAPCE